MMGDGQVIESGPPAQLLKKPGGAFASMVAASGGQSGSGPSSNPQ